MPPKNAGLPALSDDSGITVDGLDGAPGVYTADWAETPSGRDFPLAMSKVWNALEERDADYPRLAAFNCTLCIAWPDGHDEIFDGIVKGEVVWPMRGDHGFGFDPCSNPLAILKHSAKWILRKNTPCHTAPMHSQN
jgi:XTP/dITP diphosphohydrolase